MRAAATGSASSRSALRCATRDATGPQTALSEAAVEFFDLPSVEALAAHVYSKPLAKSEIAAFAPETARLAQLGDAVARDLYVRGARALGAQIVAVIGQTGLGTGSSGAAAPFPVGLIGSAFKAGEVFVEPLVETVRLASPEAQVSVVDMAAVGGSLLLAARACGRADAFDPGELSQLIDATLAGRS